MSTRSKVAIHRLKTGVPGLDEVLGGGLPEYSFNILAGAPGCGKTTLAHQIMFANATATKPALYFTVLGEPALKMLRYQQQFDFFDQSKLDKAVRFINLSSVVLDNDLGAVLNEIIKHVESVNPGIVMVDSFRTVVRKSQGSGNGDVELQGFVQRLALHLTTWQATTFLIGEYTEGEIRDNPVFTVADGLFWLSQSVERNSIVRKMQVMKLRGQESVPGLHTFRITEKGIQTFPRTFGLTGGPEKKKGNRRLSTGVPELDAMMGGGIPSGHSLLVAGPSGAGKSILGTHFIAEGLKRGEPGIVAVFEELPDEYTDRAAKLGMKFKAARKDGSLEIIYLRPLDLSVDETLYEVVAAVKRTKAKRLVIDSLVGFELALAPGFRTDFRESLYRMIGALTRLGVTILSTVEVQENFTSLGLSNYAISFLSDDIVELPTWIGVRSDAVKRELAEPDRPLVGKPLRILLVEDHADTARIMRRLLTLDGHAVEWADSVNAGLELADLHDFDLLLTDLGLPDGTGVDLMRALRDKGSTLPGIVISGYGQDQDIERCRSVGFAAHIIKPLSQERLREAIYALVG